jgi:ribosomal protein L21E
MKYDKAEIEHEAIASANQGFISENLGRFILDRANEISNHAFVTNGNQELRQALVDEAVMRVCDKFLHYYVEGKCAASLIIGMINTTMINKINSLKWRDVYGMRTKGYVITMENGIKTKRLVRYIKDDYLSEKL